MVHSQRLTGAVATIQTSHRLIGDAVEEAKYPVNLFLVDDVKTTDHLEKLLPVLTPYFPSRCGAPAGQGKSVAVQKDGRVVHSLGWINS